MNKTQALQHFTKDSDTRNFFASALDKKKQTSLKQHFTSTGFFSPEEMEDFSSLLSHLKEENNYFFFGGYEDATRKICCFLPDWMASEEEMTTLFLPMKDPSPDASPSNPPSFQEKEEGKREDDADWSQWENWEENQWNSDQERTIPILSPDEIPLSLLEIKVKGEISHRDVLGSLMGLGLTRRKFGDILLDSKDGKTTGYVLVLKETAPILRSQWAQVGRFPLSSTEIPLENLKIPPQTLKSISSTVATLRLDSLISTGFSISRSKASQLISGGFVSVNHRECKKSDKILEEGDVLVCRGLGKCVLSKVKGESKKGRIIVDMLRYL